MLGSSAVAVVNAGKTNPQYVVRGVRHSAKDNGCRVLLIDDLRSSSCSFCSRSLLWGGSGGTRSDPPAKPGTCTPRSHALVRVLMKPQVIWQMAAVPCWLLAGLPVWSLSPWGQLLGWAHQMRSGARPPPTPTYLPRYA